ncbi:MAG: transposase domain-containing protein [Burkholderia sp.]
MQIGQFITHSIFNRGQNSVYPPYTTFDNSSSLNLYSLIETCKANNVDDYEAMLPWKLGKPAHKSKT